MIVTLLKAWAAKLWPWVLVLLAVITLVIGAKLSYAKYQSMATEITDAKAATASVLEVNANLNATVIKQVQDAQDKSAANSDIAAGQETNDKNIGDLKNQLDEAIAKRDAAQALLDAKAKTDVSCVGSPSLDPTLHPTQADIVELTIAWKAYCEVTPTATQCVEKAK